MFVFYFFVVCGFYYLLGFLFLVCSVDRVVVVLLCL